MATRIIVLQDCNLTFLTIPQGGGFRKAGYVVDVLENLPNSLNFKQRTSFYSAVASNYIKAEFTAVVEKPSDYKAGSLPMTNTVPENQFKHGTVEDGANKLFDKDDKPIIETKDLNEDFAGTLEVVSEGDPDGHDAGKDRDHFFDDKMEDKSSLIPAITEEEVATANTLIEDTVSEADSEYMNGQGLPPAKEDKAYVETDVKIPDNFEKEDIQADAISMNTQVEYDADEVAQYLIDNNINKRTAKSAAKILTENITDTSEIISLYGVNTENINEIQDLLGKFAASKE